MDGLLNMPNSGFVTRFQTSTASIHIMYHAQKTIVRFWFWVWSCFSKDWEFFF
jgi:hypothetical protein